MPSNSDTGMTLSAQKCVSEVFRTIEDKILMASSVADKGIDIAQYTLVIQHE